MSDATPLDDPERLAQFRGAILDPTLDATLQSFVERAVEISGFDIGLVSLVLRRTQFFRAHTGLPPDLAVSQATDRCASFCQFVVDQRRPLSIIDALGDESLPQELVHRYGIRSYVGHPLVVSGHVLGSLCVIALEPRELSADAHEKLASLAVEAAGRLDQLGQHPSAWLLPYALQPGFAELRNMLVVLDGAGQEAELSLTELSRTMEVLRAVQSGELTVAELRRVLPVLDEARLSFEDLRTGLTQAMVASRRIRETIVTLEATLARERNGVDVSRAVEQACVLARHTTRLVGGVETSQLPKQVHLDVEPMSAVTVLATVLRAVAEIVHGRTDRGLVVEGCSIQAEGRFILSVISEDLEPDDAPTLQGVLQELIATKGLVQIHPDRVDMNWPLSST